jgi:hypothetical protein
MLVGSQNGALELKYNCTTVSQTALGYQALKVSTTGTENVAVGYQALLEITQQVLEILLLEHLL